jgi:ribose 5-phosphate isomerase B
MKTVKDKYLVVGADFAGFPLKEVVEHLTKKGWNFLDLGVKKDSDPADTDLMFHRVGLRVAASKCPHVHAGVVESLPCSPARNYR